jgi:hypothetical protein
MCRLLSLLAPVLQLASEGSLSVCGVGGEQFRVCDLIDPPLLEYGEVAFVVGTKFRPTAAGKTVVPQVGAITKRRCTVASAWGQLRAPAITIQPTGRTRHFQ